MTARYQDCVARVIVALALVAAGWLLLSQPNPTPPQATDAKHASVASDLGWPDQASELEVARVELQHPTEAPEIPSTFIPPPVAGRLHGRVLDAWGRPAAGVRVLLWPELRRSEPTDEDGRYSLPIVHAGPHFVRAYIETRVVATTPHVRLELGQDAKAPDLYFEMPQSH